ncbi:MAG: hypothetical protein D6719_02725 [Candidatus Dadabacteria bacterium]|nr:MAG: hypothetical protein D6719_02725 [Candidatus Dadabacteria bacterium]
MGNIAKFGIIAGKKVDLNKFETSLIEGKLNPFIERCLKEYHALDIGHKVLSGERLTTDEMKFLVEKASTGLLLKLIELCPGRLRELRLPQPILVLPLSSWLWECSELELIERSFKRIAECASSRPAVLVDQIPFERLKTSITRLFSEIRQRFGPVKILGSSVGEIMGTRAGGSGSLPDDLVVSRLIQLKEAGLSGVLGTAATERLHLLKEVGLTYAVRTNLDLISSDQEIVDVLKHLREVMDRDRTLDLWIPSLLERGSAAAELRVLRVAAIGAIVLDKIRFIRATSVALSLEGMRMAKRFGANDFGYGAVDDFTADALGIDRIERLREVLSKKSGSRSRCSRVQ